jgi:hypothetical protein
LLLLSLGLLQVVGVAEEIGILFPGEFERWLVVKEEAAVAASAAEFAAEAADFVTIVLADLNT